MPRQWASCASSSVVTQGGHVSSEPGQVSELRLVVTATDYESALHFYRDVLGLLAVSYTHLTLPTILLV